MNHDPKQLKFDLISLNIKIFLNGSFIIGDWFEEVWKSFINKVQHMQCI